MYLLDTDTIIYALKNDARVVAELSRRHDAPKALSVITYGELIYGAEKSAKREENLARVRRLAELFPIIDVSPAIVETFGRLKSRLESKGRRIDDFDLLIGSTALSIGYVLVTGNTRHFSRIPGLKVESWSAQRL